MQIELKEPHEKANNFVNISISSKKETVNSEEFALELIRIANEIKKYGMPIQGRFIHNSSGLTTEVIRPKWK